MDDQYFCKPIDPRRKSCTDDHGIQATNDDAVEAKSSAASLGYYKDDFIHHFYKKPERKPPEIHRGYYARVKIVRMLVDRFLQIAGSKAQIVNLGAGFDTLYWRLIEDDAKFHKFIDIDFSSITTKKIYHITKPHSPLQKFLGEPIQQVEHRDLFSPRYSLLGADIRDLNELDTCLQRIPDLDKTLPTLFLAECVLVYMACQQSLDLCQFLAKNFRSAVFVNYELVNLTDNFGDVFKQNMASRGLSIPGIDTCQSLQCQIDRFTRTEWPHVEGYVMTDVYDKIIDKKDRKRIEAIEFLDETELLTQLLRHYCVIVAVNGEKGDLKKMFL